MNEAEKLKVLAKERKDIVHIMRLLKEWGQLDIKGFPLIQSLVEKLENGESCLQSYQRRVVV